MDDGKTGIEKKQAIEKAEQVLYKTYNRFPVIFDHGKGVHLYDSDELLNQLRILTVKSTL